MTSLDDSSSIIVLVEPILRGSRLQITANFIESILHKRPGKKITIVTRNDWHTSHYDELLGAYRNSITIHSSGMNLDGAWIKTLNRNEWKEVLDTLEKVLRTSSCESIIFMALDDYLASFAINAFYARKITKTIKVFTVKYRIEYLKTHISKLPFLQKAALLLVTVWCLKLSRSSLLCFDERLDRDSYFGIKTFILPDPWFGDYSKNYRESARALLNINPSDFVLATIGRQDRRKGFSQLLGNLQSLLAQPNFKLLVVGAIAAEFQEKFEELKLLSPDRIIHINRFVPDSELKQYFSAADLYLLAYSLDFTSSSGTLVRAAASGVPLLACNHGLVGHRVAANRIGVCFDVTNKDSMVAAINEFHLNSENSHHDIQSNLADFADRNTILKFSESVSTAIFNAR